MSNLRSRLAGMNKKAEVDQITIDNIKNCRDQLLQLHQSISNLNFSSDNQGSIQIFNQHKDEIVKALEEINLKMKEFNKDLEKI